MDIAKKIIVGVLTALVLGTLGWAASIDRELVRQRVEMNSLSEIKVLLECTKKQVEDIRVDVAVIKTQVNILGRGKDGAHAQVRVSP
jgi:hypothetical protein